MYTLYLLLLGLFFRCCVASPQPTTSTTTTTTTSGPAGPSVSSCKGPQRYQLEAYDTKNNTHYGHLLAEEGDGDIFLLLIAKSNPDNQPYFGEWSFSAAPQDHNDVYIYLPPDEEGVDRDFYYPILYGNLNDAQLQVGSRSEAGQNFIHFFHVTQNPKTHVLSFTIPQYQKPHTFALVPFEQGAFEVDYVETDKVPAGETPIYLKAVKSC